MGVRGCGIGNAECGIKDPKYPVDPACPVKCEAYLTGV
jgi:hypothetical protein